jgi:predicted flavoprotein YhiN
LGLTVIPPVPSLFTFNIPSPHHKIDGYQRRAAEGEDWGSKLIQEGPVLITHWGISGPAVLKLSAWGARELADLNYQFKVAVNWCNLNENRVREKIQEWRQEFGSQKILNRNPFQLPQRLWEHLLQQAGIDEQLRWADVPGKLQNKLISLLTNHEFEVKGKTTFGEEFVTAGD